jgi:hypothetical protein
MPGRTSARHLTSTITPHYHDSYHPPTSSTREGLPLFTSTITRCGHDSYHPPTAELIQWTTEAQLRTSFLFAKIMRMCIRGNFQFMVDVDCIMLLGTWMAASAAWCVLITPMYILCVCVQCQWVASASCHLCTAARNFCCSFFACAAQLAWYGVVMSDNTTRAHSRLRATFAVCMCFIFALWLNVCLALSSCVSFTRAYVFHTLLCITYCFCASAVCVPHKRVCMCLTRLCASHMCLTCVLPHNRYTTWEASGFIGSSPRPVRKAHGGADTSLGNFRSTSPKPVRRCADVMIALSSVVLLTSQTTFY